MIEKFDDQNGFCMADCIDKINEVIGAVNKQQDIIRQIGEWGSEKGECLWCEKLTEVNLNDRMIGCTTLDIPESYKELHKAVKSANVKLANHLDIAIDALCEIAKEDSVSGLRARKALDKIKNDK